MVTVCYGEQTATLKMVVVDVNNNQLLWEGIGYRQVLLTGAYYFR